MNILLWFGRRLLIRTLFLKYTSSILKDDPISVTVSSIAFFFATISPYFPAEFECLELLMIAFYRRQFPTVCIEKQMFGWIHTCLFFKNYKQNWRAFDLFAVCFRRLISVKNQCLFIEEVRSRVNLFYIKVAVVEWSPGWNKYST